MDRTENFTTVMPLMGGLPTDLIEQAEHGRLIGMADQLIRTVQRENEQAKYANGVIITRNGAQYF